MTSATRRTPRGKRRLIQSSAAAAKTAGWLTARARWRGPGEPAPREQQSRTVHAGAGVNRPKAARVFDHLGGRFTLRAYEQRQTFEQLAVREQSDSPHGSGLSCVFGALRWPRERVSQKVWVSKSFEHRKRARRLVGREADAGEPSAVARASGSEKPFSDSSRWAFRYRWCPGPTTTSFAVSAEPQPALRAAHVAQTGHEQPVSPSSCAAPAAFAESFLRKTPDVDKTLIRQHELLEFINHVSHGSIRSNSS